MQLSAPSPGPDGARLAVARDARLAWRAWDDQTVIHHALSNDTHRLAEPAGTLLRLLENDGPQSPTSLAHACGLAPDELDGVLQALVELNLVVWC